MSKDSDEFSFDVDGGLDEMMDDYIQAVDPKREKPFEELFNNPAHPTGRTLYKLEKLRIFRNKIIKDFNKGQAKKKTSFRAIASHIALMEIVCLERNVVVEKYKFALTAKEAEELYDPEDGCKVLITSDGMDELKKKHGL